MYSVGFLFGLGWGLFCFFFWGGEGCWVLFCFHKTGDWSVCKAPNTKYWLLQNFVTQDITPGLCNPAESRCVAERWKIPKFLIGWNLILPHLKNIVCCQSDSLKVMFVWLRIDWKIVFILVAGKANCFCNTHQKAECNKLTAFTCISVSVGTEPFLFADFSILWSRAGSTEAGGLQGALRRNPKSTFSKLDLIPSCLPSWPADTFHFN